MPQASLKTCIGESAGPCNLQGTVDRLKAVRTKPIKKGHPGAKRQGARAVKQLEGAANADFLLSGEEATLYRALSARANFLSQDKPDMNFSFAESLQPPTRNLICA